MKRIGRCVHHFPTLHTEGSPHLGGCIVVTTWEQGRPTLDRLIQEGRLARVPVNLALAHRYLEQVERHLVSSRVLASQDPGSRRNYPCSFRQASGYVGRPQTQVPVPNGSLGVLTYQYISQAF